MNSRTERYSLNYFVGTRFGVISQSNKPRTKFINIGNQCEKMRIIKTKEEIALTQRAYRYFDKIHILWKTPSLVANSLSGLCSIVLVIISSQILF